MTDQSHILTVSSGSREWDEVFRIVRTDYQRERLQLLRAELVIGSILLSLTNAEQSLGDYAEADIARAKARIAYETAKGYLRDLRLGEEQTIFVQSKLEELARSLEVLSSGTADRSDRSSCADQPPKQQRQH